MQTAEQKPAELSSWILLGIIENVFQNRFVDVDRKCVAVDRSDGPPLQRSCLARSRFWNRFDHGLVRRLSVTVTVAEGDFRRTGCQLTLGERDLLDKQDIRVFGLDDFSFDDLFAIDEQDIGSWVWGRRDLGNWRLVPVESFRR